MRMTLIDSVAWLGLLKVLSDRFCWIKGEQAVTLIAQLEMGDFQAVKQVRLVLLFHQPRFQGDDFSPIQQQLNGGRREVGQKEIGMAPPCEPVASPDILNNLIDQGRVVQSPIKLTQH